MIQYSNINDAWGNKETFKKNNLNNIENLENKKNVNVENLENKKNVNVEKLETEPINLSKQNNYLFPHQPNPMNSIQNENYASNTCSFSEHLKTCEHCRNSLAEYFTNDSSMSTINLFGLKINITKDVLKVIFVILIILIFVILLSTINYSFKERSANMKYYMMAPPHHIPYYR